ncbi:MAG: DNA repair protein RecN [Candidatus Oxydemutatoraceae bacterium WSBS_2016_MAG_OTU14]
MLQSLSIKNYIFPSTLDLNFVPGMAVITGETGAGKSLLIEAIHLLLGKKTIPATALTDASLNIHGLFDVSHNPPAQAWLKQHNLVQDICAIQLTAHKTPQSKIRTQFVINDQPIARNLIKDLGDALVESVGQHAHHRLANSKNHLPILDNYCQHNEQVQQLNTIWQDWNACLGKIETIKHQHQESERHLELLHYHLTELDALTPQEDEYEEIDREHKRMAQIEQSTEHIQKAYDILYQSEDNSMYTQIAQTVGQLSAIENDPDISVLREQLESVMQTIQEISSNLHQWLGRPAMDQETFNALEKRLGDYIQLARKHQISPSELAAHHRNLLEEIHQIENPQDSLDRLQKQNIEYAKQYHLVAQKLSATRQKKAATLMQEVTHTLHGLNMPAANFLINFSTDENQPRSNGIDHIEFFLQSNAKQLPLPIGKVASGGELSRVSLAIQIRAWQDQLTNTLIFDEVDAGIGGKTAEMVGMLLQSLSDKTQVLCVTHLAQIAKFAQTHFYVEKKTSNDTHITIKKLHGNHRDQEIARMLSGEKITAKTLAHAHELLNEIHEKKQ